jgi:4-amino-4-deoxychorismate lyase
VAAAGGSDRDRQERSLSSAPVLDCLVNGELSFFVSVNDRGLGLADGVWERVAVVGGRPWWWQDHIDRLSRGCERLGIDPPDQSVLLRELQTVSAGRSRSVVKILLSRGEGAFAYAPSGTGSVTRVVAAYPWPAGGEQRASLGVTARLCDFRLSVQPALGGINHLNRLELVLAAREIQSHGAEEGLLLDTDDHLISAINSNIFLVIGDQLLTPRMDRSGVRGVLRGRILREFKKRCELRRITLDMLPEADEAFLCDVVGGIVPLLAIGDLELPAGPVTRDLQEWLKSRQDSQ